MEGLNAPLLNFIKNYDKIYIEIKKGDFIICSIALLNGLEKPPQTRENE